MLSKSIKHELRATSRVVLPLFAALLLLSVMANLSVHFFVEMEHPFWQTVGALFIVIFIFSLLAVFLGVMILMIQRFVRSFLSDEGYLNMTLPVSVHTHIFSRLLVSVLWYFLTIVAVLTAILVMCIDMQGQFFGAFGEIVVLLWDGLKLLRGKELFELILLFLEGIVSMVLAAAGASLLYYAAFAIGHSFQRHKMALSIVFIFAINWVLSFINTLLLLGADMDRLMWYMEVQIDSAGKLALVLLIPILLSLFQCMVLYALTYYFMKKKLNLQ